MRTTRADYTETRIKHLEMILRVIERIAGNSGWVKRFCLAVVGGAIALSRFNENGGVLIGAAVVTCVFWYIDAQYLDLERRYRRLYDKARKEPKTKRPDFNLKLGKEHKNGNWIDTAASWSVWPVYGTLILLLVLMAIFT